MRRFRRRQFVIAAGALLTAPLVAEAQPSGAVYRIGWLTAGSGPIPLHAAFFDALRELGYIEGRNIIVERRFAAGSANRLNEIAAELVALKVDLIVAAATSAAQAARKATTTIPIIFVAVVDPVGAGLVASLARPTGNITGLSLVSAELIAKRLELISEVVPKLSRIAVFLNPTNASNTLQLREAEAAARTLRVQLQLLKVQAPNDFEGAFQAAVRERAGALMMLDDPLGYYERARVASLAAKHRLPAIYGFKESAEAGGLIAYGTSLPHHYQRAAIIVDKVLKGARPVDLPVEQPTKFELVINLKTAKALGLTIAQSMLLRADRVIE